jgi:hypothetical protein
MNYTVYGSRNEELRNHQVHWFKKQQAFWTKLVKEAVKSNELPEQLDPADTAEQLLIFAHGLMVRQILQPDKRSQAHCRKLLEQYFERLETETGERKADVDGSRELTVLSRRGKAAA